MLDPTICPQCFQPNEADRTLCWKCMRALAKPPSVQDYVRFFELKGSWGRSEVKIAYLRLAKKYHPDANVGNREANAFFKFVNRGSEVLTPLTHDLVEIEERKVEGKDPYAPAVPDGGMASKELYEKLLTVVRSKREEGKKKEPDTTVQKFRKWLNNLSSKKI